MFQEVIKKIAFLSRKDKINVAGNCKIISCLSKQNLIYEIKNTSRMHFMAELDIMEDAWLILKAAPKPPSPLSL